MSFSELSASPRRGRDLPRWKRRDTETNEIDGFCTTQRWCNADVGHKPVSTEMNSVGGYRIAPRSYSLDGLDWPSPAYLGPTQHEVHRVFNLQIPGTSIAKPQSIPAPATCCYPKVITRVGKSSPRTRNISTSAALSRPLPWFCISIATSCSLG